MTKRIGIQLLVWLVLSLFAVGSALAQSTSAAVTGRITDASGQPVVGASVQILHVPSGTTKTATTDADGRYNARGLRVGGPFTITAEKSGLQSASKEQVSLLLAETSTVDISMGAPAAELEAIEVVAAAQSSVFVPDNMGSGTNVTKEQIESFPSISRSIQDYVRLDPRIVQTDKERGEISAGGQNSRYNNISIDGVPTNDEFGLESGGLPSFGNPISIDTIEEFNIAVSSYDVSASDFVGGNINAVTKSGTNEFHGSVYGIYRDSDMIGEDENGNEFTSFDDEQTYGMTLGGPILKDTLFFFIAYEEFERAAPGPELTPRVSQADIDRVISIANGFGVTNIGTASPPGNIDNTDEKFLAKLDWNINEDHRFSTRYNKTESSILIIPNFSISNVSLSSHWYTQERAFESLAAHLYSDWSDNFSTELSISEAEFDSVPLNFSNLPQVRVRVDAANSVWFGTEQFRHANVLASDTLTGYFAGDWFLGDHTFKFGGDYRENDFFNLFVESSLGRYEFASIDAFAARGPFTNYTLRQPRIPNDPNSAAALWSYDTIGFFLQDTWQVSYNLSLQYGFRVDTPNVDTTPLFNQTFTNTFGFRNDATIDGNEVVQPRMGFNYTFEASRPTQLRGGLGLFQGSAAGVWLSNPFTNPGGTINVLTINNGTGFNPNPGEPPVPITPGSLRQDVDVLADGFEQPTVWKANIAFDHELPWWGLVASAEYMLAQTENAIQYSHLNLGAPFGFLPDGRQSFWRSTSPANFSNPLQPASAAGSRGNANALFNDVLLLSNTSKGDASNFTLSLEKPFANNWYGKIAYTYGDAEEVNPGTSSRAISNWNSRQIFNPNEDVASTANYEIKQRYTAALSYRHFFFDDLATTVSMFYEGREGRPYSWAFSNDANGDRISNNDLFYVPLGPGDVLFTNPAEEAAFWDFIESNDYLNSQRGNTVSRNSVNGPWVNQFDLRISQELPGIWRGKGELFFDIINFGNLLNDEWGQIDEVSFPGGRGVAQFAGVDPATGRYVYRYPLNAQGQPTLPFGLSRRDAAAQSRWALQIGVRYEF